MRKVIMYCDRCKKEFDKWDHKRKELIGVAEIVYDSGDPYLDSQMDLCESCYAELEKWWNFDSQVENAEEVETGKEILRAMQESAEAVKNSPHYDFSCVTPLLGEGAEVKEQLCCECANINQCWEEYDYMRTHLETHKNGTCHRYKKGAE